MNGHVTEMLASYYDGELHGSQKQQVEAHLSTCTECRAELASLRRLTELLGEPPLPESILPPGRFRSQVMLRLPPAVYRPAWQQALKSGWQFAPAGAVLAWAIWQAVWLVGGLGSILYPSLNLSGAGLTSGWLGLAGAGLSVRGAEALLGLILLNLGVSALVALFLGGWLATWWVASHHSLDGNSLLREEFTTNVGTGLKEL